MLRVGRSFNLCTMPRKNAGTAPRTKGQGHTEHHLVDAAQALVGRRPREQHRRQYDEPVEDRVRRAMNSQPMATVVNQNRPLPGSPLLDQEGQDVLDQLAKQAAHHSPNMQTLQLVLILVAKSIL